MKEKQLGSTISIDTLYLPHYLRNLSVYLLLAHVLKWYIPLQSLLAKESNDTNCVSCK